VTPEELFAEHPLAMSVVERVGELLASLSGVEVRASRSQVAFRRRRGFAYVWLPGRYLARPDAEVVLSIALRRRLESHRFKEVVEPSPGQWMHHLEISAAADLDAEVAEWLRSAAESAA